MLTQNDNSHTTSSLTSSQNTEELNIRVSLRDIINRNLDQASFMALNTRAPHIKTLSLRINIDFEETTTGADYTQFILFLERFTALNVYEIVLYMDDEVVEDNNNIKINQAEFAYQCLNAIPNDAPLRVLKIDFGPDDLLENLMNYSPDFIRLMSRHQLEEVSFKHANYFDLSTLPPLFREQGVLQILTIEDVGPQCLHELLYDILTCTPTLREVTIHDAVSNFSAEIPNQYITRLWPTPTSPEASLHHAPSKTEPDFNNEDSRLNLPPFSWPKFATNIEHFSLTARIESEFWAHYGGRFKTYVFPQILRGLKSIHLELTFDYDETDYTSDFANYIGPLLWEGRRSLTSCTGRILSDGSRPTYNITNAFERNSQKNQTREHSLLSKKHTLLVLKEACSSAKAIELSTTLFQLLRYPVMDPHKENVRRLYIHMLFEHFFPAPIFFCLEPYLNRSDLATLHCITGGLFFRQQKGPLRYRPSNEAVASAAVESVEATQTDNTDNDESNGPVAKKMRR